MFLPRLLRSRASHAACAGLALGALVAAPVLGYREGPLPDRVGACGWGPSCADLSCHDSFLVDQTVLPWSLELASGLLPGPYVPGRRYPMVLRIDERLEPFAPIWGFALAPMVGCPFPVAAGDLTVVDPGRTRRLHDAGLVYLTHLCTCATEDPACCGFRPQFDPSVIEWPFLWDAPPAGTGEITFALAMNAANWDTTREGDRITLASALIPEDLSCPPATRDLRVRKEACDATGLQALALDWSASGAPFRVRATTEVASAPTDRAGWADAGTLACVPMPPEPLVFLSVAEDCGSGAEGIH